MSEVCRALLIHDQDQPLDQLTEILENLQFEVVRTRSCGEAVLALSEEGVPTVVFTDVTLPDGTWKDVLHAVRSSNSPVHVILVSRVVDDPLYITALESGAADFVVPPFREVDVAHIVGSSLKNRKPRKPVV